MVKTSNAYQRLVAEALEVINKENVALKEQVRNSKALGSKEVETVSKGAKSIGSEVKKHSVDNFYITEAYQSFEKYWRKYAHIEVV